MNDSDPIPTGVEAAVCKDIATRQQFGINKYGMTVADNPADRRQRLRHLYEELLDAAVYARWEIMKLDGEAPESEDDIHISFPPIIGAGIGGAIILAIVYWMVR